MISNSKLKRLQSLRLKKYRQKYNLFLAEGDKVFHSLQQQENYGIAEIYATEEWLATNKVTKGSSKVIVTTQADMKKISSLKSNSSVICVVRIPGNPPQTIQFGRAIFLENVQDPGNVGSIIRTADWYGIEAVIRSGDSADFYNPKVVQSTMGSFANVQLITADLSDLRVWTGHLPLLASSLEGRPLDDIPGMTDFCLVIGSEGKGVSTEVINESDELIKITGDPERLADSLNAAVATGILCHHLINTK